MSGDHETPRWQHLETKPRSKHTGLGCVLCKGSSLGLKSSCGNRRQFFSPTWGRSGAVPGRLPGKVGSQEVPGTGFRDGSLGEPVAVALVAALVLKGAILCVRSSVLAV